MEVSPQAGVTQLVECNLAKVDVAGSNPVSRSKRSFASAEPASLAGIRSSAQNIKTLMGSPSRVRSRSIRWTLHTRIGDQTFDRIVIGKAER
jgi:hypothetical protein